MGALAVACAGLWPLVASLHVLASFPFFYSLTSSPNPPAPRFSSAASLAAQSWLAGPQVQIPQEEPLAGPAWIGGPHLVSHCSQGRRGYDVDHHPLWGDQWRKKACGPSSSLGLCPCPLLVSEQISPGFWARLTSPPFSSDSCLLPDSLLASHSVNIAFRSSIHICCLAFSLFTFSIFPSSIPYTSVFQNSTSNPLNGPLSFSHILSWAVYPCGPSSCPSDGHLLPFPCMFPGLQSCQPVTLDTDISHKLLPPSLCFCSARMLVPQKPCICSSILSILQKQSPATSTVTFSLICFNGQGHHSYGMKHKLCSRMLCNCLCACPAPRVYAMWSPASEFLRPVAHNCVFVWLSMLVPQIPHEILSSLMDENLSYLYLHSA